MNEECGLFGVYNSETAARDIYLGLHAQQHRGQEGAGIILSEGNGTHRVHKDLGLVTNVFSEGILQRLENPFRDGPDPTFGLGHVRYSTSGHVTAGNTQPLVVTHQDRLIALTHNGDLTNAGILKERLEEEGSVFNTTSDSEVILHRVIRADAEDPVEKIKEGLADVRGAYSVLFLLDEGIGGVRDPHGFRPLHIGRRETETGETYCFASETCGFDILDAEPVAEIEPGQGYFVSEEGVRTFRLPGESVSGMCSFESIYFSRPDSFYRGRSIHQYRVEMGRALWREHPVEADLVTGVPDSSNSATKGFADASGLPQEITLIRSHYTGRTFIAPYQSLRNLKVKKKFNLVPDTVEGKRVVIVDDSIVRGTTMKNIAQMFRERGAREIHVRIASPPVAHPCYYGIDIPDEEELLINRVPLEEMPDHLGVESVRYLSVESVREVVGEQNCRACFTGNYPVEVEDDGDAFRKSDDPNGNGAASANGSPIGTDLDRSSNVNV